MSIMTLIHGMRTAVVAPTNVTMIAPWGNINSI